MKKIISLFQRNYDTDRLVRDEVTPGAEWVIEGEGVPTVKWDGTCCMIRDGKLYKRYELKPNKKPPANFEPATGIDQATGKVQGWVPVGDGPEDQYHREAMNKGLPDGTYELLGPKIQGNPHGYTMHFLRPHGGNSLDPFPRDFSSIKASFKEWREKGISFEGVVWHHPDGRMVKIKVRDFGIQ